MVSRTLSRAVFAVAAGLSSLAACNAVLGNEAGELSATGAGGQAPVCSSPVKAWGNGPFGGTARLLSAASYLKSGEARIDHAWHDLGSDVWMTGPANGVFALDPDDLTVPEGHFLAVARATTETEPPKLLGVRALPGRAVVLGVGAGRAVVTKLDASFTIEQETFEGEDPSALLYLLMSDLGEFLSGQVHHAPEPGALLYWNAGAARDVPAPILIRHYQRGEHTHTEVTRLDGLGKASSGGATLTIDSSIAKLLDSHVGHDGSVVLGFTPSADTYLNGLGPITTDTPDQTGVIVAYDSKFSAGVAVLHGVSAEQVVGAVSLTSAPSVLVAGKVLTSAEHLVLARTKLARCAAPGDTVLARIDELVGEKASLRWAVTLSGIDDLRELELWSDQAALLVSASGNIEVDGASVPGGGVVLLFFDPNGNLTLAQQVPASGATVLVSAWPGLLVAGGFSGQLPLVPPLSAPGAVADLSLYFSPF